MKNFQQMFLSNPVKNHFQIKTFPAPTRTKFGEHITFLIQDSTALLKAGGLENSLLIALVWKNTVWLQVSKKRVYHKSMVKTRK